MFNKSTLTITTSALVLMSTGVAGAASNPFSDVPQDSWAYDAVATLAADGVIDGFPDGTYQGNKTMTRYEMAQIVARAMAKTDLEKADKALVDKLAAEFADELDNLGVRVADLEKKSDNVVWKGELRYRYVDASSDAVSKITGKKYNDNDTSQVMFRLEPKAYIGDTGWTANVRVDYEMKADEDANGKTFSAPTTIEVLEAYPAITDITVELTPNLREGEDNVKSGAIIANLAAVGGTEMFSWTIQGNEAGNFVISNSSFMTSPGVTFWRKVFRISCRLLS